MLNNSNDMCSLIFGVLHENAVSMPSRETIFYMVVDQVNQRCCFVLFSNFRFSDKKSHFASVIN